MAFTRKSVLVITVVAITTLLTTTVWSKPPPWAPAHGYRNKHNNYEYNVGYAKDLEIFEGRCNYEKAGTILGAVIGGVLGSKVGDGDGKKIMTVAGTILGAVIGKRVGARLDEKDRYCTGQALEHAKNGQAVTWQNPETKIAYTVTPVNSYQQGNTLCRQFTVETTAPNGVNEKRDNDACRDDNNVWSTLY